MAQVLKGLLVILFLAAGMQARSQQKLPKVVPYDSLRTVLEKIYDTDQGIRMKMDSVKKEDMNAFFRQMRRIDSLNQIQVQEILTRYGWLPQSKVGKKAANGLFFVVQHAPTPVIEKHLPALQRLAQQGEADKALTAMMEDRLLMYQGKKQVYGTQAVSLLSEDGSMVIWPIENPKQVNDLRKKAGFNSTVEENAKRLNATYNPDQALPKEKIKFN